MSLEEGVIDTEVESMCKDGDETTTENDSVLSLPNDCHFPNSNNAYSAVETSETLISQSPPPSSFFSSSKNEVMLPQNIFRRLCRCGWPIVLTCACLVVMVIAAVLYRQVIYESRASNSSSNNAATKKYFNDIEISWASLPPESQVLTSLAFGSCSSQYMPQPYWDTVALVQPELVILLGDNVYGDCHDDECNNLKLAYTNWSSHVSFQGAANSFPMVGTLDDHDYGIGDATMFNPYKDIAKQMYLDFFDIFDERRTRQNDGVYHHWEWGPVGRRVQVIALDVRYSKSEFVANDNNFGPPFIPDYNATTSEKQMMSQQEWKWLEEEVLTIPANIRIIMSSIQTLNDVTGFECWRMIPNERQRLYDLLSQSQIRTKSRNIIVSGDRHVGGFYRYPLVSTNNDNNNNNNAVTEEDILDESMNMLYEITASSWTHTIPLGAFNDCQSPKECDEVDERRMGDFVRENHFGMVSIDWDKRQVEVSLRRAETTPGFLYPDPNHHTRHSNAGERMQAQTYSIPL